MLLQGEETPGELGRHQAGQPTAHLRQARGALDVPTRTAEPWPVWLAHPELAKEVDYIAVHILPYWEGLSVDEAIKFVLDQYRRVQEAFPDKPVVLTEVGWPSHGHSFRDAIPSIANEARFLRRFLNVAREKGIDYYVMEAFDQPWKADVEGSVGPYWGIFDADRKPKVDLSGPIRPVRGWFGLFAGATGLALFPIVWFLTRARALRPEGQVFFAGLIQVSQLGAAAPLAANAAVRWIEATSARRSRSISSP